MIASCRIQGHLLYGAHEVARNARRTHLRIQKRQSAQSAPHDEDFPFYIVAAGTVGE